MSDQIPMPANEEQAVGVCDALSRFCLACRAVVKAYGLSSGHSIIQSPKGGILFRAALFSERRDSRALQLLARWILCASSDVGYRQAERTSIRESALQEAQRYGQCRCLLRGQVNALSGVALSSSIVGFFAFIAQVAAGTDVEASTIQQVTPVTMEAARESISGHEGVPLYGACNLHGSGWAFS